jgi:DNA-binding GntR family transcriptional regulator
LTGWLAASRTIARVAVARDQAISARPSESSQTMEVPQIKKRSLVERLVAEVRGQISAGKLAVGQQLPTEAKMAAEFGVSRPLLREALA